MAEVRKTAKIASGQKSGVVVPKSDAAPKLTLPPTEAALLTEAYTAAEIILEYGAGGSTVLAAGMAGKSVYSVESDRGWSEGLADYFVNNPPKARVVLHHVDIGETGAWGTPVNTDGYESYPDYPMSVWDRTDFLHPDLVLIDGRFRAACFLATLYRITRPVRVLWDDYADRPAYHEVERLAKPVAMHGRMAEFHLTPTLIANANLAWVVTQFTRKL